MISYEKRYAVYRLETYRGEIKPALEEQLQDIFGLYRERFHQDPPEVFVGPIQKGEQTFVKYDEVFIPLDRIETLRKGIDGYDLAQANDT